MQRLVPYDDDEEDVSAIPIAPASSRAAAPSTAPASSALTIPKPPSISSSYTVGKPSAKTIYLESDAFKSAFQKGQLHATGSCSSISAAASRISGTRVKAKGFTEVGEMYKDGPWAPAPSEEELEEMERQRIEEEYAARRAAKKMKEDKNITEDVAAKEAVAIQPSAPSIIPPSATSSRTSPLSSEFHGKSSTDYQGRTFVDERRWPSKLSFFATGEDDDDDAAEEEALDDGVAKMFGKRKDGRKHARRECRLPQSTRPPPTREYTGHSSGISKVRLYGCLALTAGLDGTVMLWDASLPDDIAGATAIGLADDRGAIRSYRGHDGRAVRDCCFQNNSPAHFVSCGYDGYARLWDTETGKVVNDFRSGERNVSVNGARFRPGDDTSLLLAFADRRLRHWDIRQPGGDKPSQTYDFHQSSVSSVNFCANGDMFISTGEDRKLLVWGWNSPSPLKIISELWIPGMPTTAVHPNTLSFVSVGLDNKLFRFQINPNSDVVKKKGEYSPENFQVAGYSCEPSFSACGTFLACGDGTGRIHTLRVRQAFDSSSSKPKATVQVIEGAHSQNTPVSCVQFHPCFDGVLVSAGWDGKLRWWS